MKADASYHKPDDTLVELKRRFNAGAALQLVRNLTFVACALIGFFAVERLSIAWEAQAIARLNSVLVQVDFAREQQQAFRERLGKPDLKR